MVSTAPADVQRQSPLRRVLHRRIFTVPYLAEAQSILGDQLARVAIAVIVLRATGSTPATAAVYAATFLPAVAGGYLIAQIGDRVDRRAVMIACDLLRAACFLVIAVNPHNMALLVVLVVVGMSLGPVFSAAQISMLAAHVDVDEFTAGNGLRLVTSQGAQVAGFALGGVIIALFDPRDALLINAVTFLASAFLVLFTLGSARVSHSAKALAAEGIVEGANVEAGRHRDDGRGSGLWHGAGVRPLVVSSLCIGFFVVPEGLAVPYAASLGAGAVSAGILLAAGALGGVIGAGVLVRLNAQRRARVSSWMSVVCGIPLMVSVALVSWQLSWWLVAACWLLSGGAAAYVVSMTSAVMHALPEDLRSKQVGRLSALLLAAQGVAIIGFGAIAGWTSPSWAVGIAGAAGATIVVITQSVAAISRDSDGDRHDERAEECAAA